MTTALSAAYQELAAQMGDRWNGTTSGAGSSTTMVDAALMAKANDWIGDDAYVFLTEEPAGAAAIYDERKISSLSNTAGTLTTLAFAAAPGTGIDYEINRMVFQAARTFLCPGPDPTRPPGQRERSPSVGAGMAGRRQSSTRHGVLGRIAKGGLT